MSVLHLQTSANLGFVCIYFSLREQKPGSLDLRQRQKGKDWGASRVGMWDPSLQMCN